MLPIMSRFFPGKLVLRNTCVVETMPCRGLTEEKEGIIDII